MSHPQLPQSESSGCNQETIPGLNRNQTGAGAQSTPNQVPFQGVNVQGVRLAQGPAPSQDLPPCTLSSVLSHPPGASQGSVPCPAIPQRPAASPYSLAGPAPGVQETLGHLSFPQNASSLLGPLEVQQQQFNRRGQEPLGAQVALRVSQRLLVTPVAQACAWL